MSQVSELQRGLVFSSKLDEWGAGRDEVSGIMPTKTDVYNCLDRQGSGRRSLQFDGVDDYVALPTIPAFGTGDFTVIMKCMRTTADWFVLGGSTDNGVTIIISNNHFQFSSYVQSHVSNNTSIPINTWATIGYSRTGTTGTYYLNGVADGTVTDTENYTSPTLLNNSSVWGVAGGGSISMCRIFNYTLSAQQIANYSRPEYPIEWVDRGATGANIMSGYNFTNWSLSDLTATSNTLTVTAGYGAAEKNLALKIGSKYLLSLAGSLTAGATYNVKGASTIYFTTSSTNLGSSTQFTCTNATLSIVQVGNGSVSTLSGVNLVQLGCVLDLNAEGINRQNISTVSASYWWDATNNITATVSGASVSIPSASNMGTTWFGGATGSRVVLPQAEWTGDITISFNMLFQNYGDGDASFFFDNGSLQMLAYVGRTDLEFSRTGNGVDFLSISTPSFNTEHRVVITSTSSGITKAYVDGIYINGSTIAIDTTSATNITIGNGGDNTFSLNGYIKDFKIYHKILDADQIKLLNDTN